MAENVRLWEISEGDGLTEIEKSKLDLEERLEKWIEGDISILADNLLVIGRQVQTEFGGVIDLLCIDDAGDLVVVELKRHKTPREITAQALDYASWVADLSDERINKIADAYLGSRGPLDDAFRERFKDDLPDALNEDHRILVVASEIDSSSERIIKYLSERYNVGINAATFQYFPDGDRELLARVFLIEPSDIVPGGTSTGRARLTYEQLRNQAEDKGVLELYAPLVEGLGRFFSRRRTRSSIGFKAEIDGGRKTIISLIPQESSSDSGLRFQVYIHRLAQLLGVKADEAAEFLPASREPWKYYEAADEDWAGYSGFFKNSEEATRLLSAFAEAKKRAGSDESA